MERDTKRKNNVSLSNTISSYKMIFTTKPTKIFLVVQWDGSYEVNITHGDFGDQIRQKNGGYIWQQEVCKSDNKKCADARYYSIKNCLFLINYRDNI